MTSSDCSVTIDWFVFCGSIESKLFQFKVKSLLELKYTGSVFVLKNDCTPCTEQEIKICEKLKTIPLNYKNNLIDLIKTSTSSIYFCILRSNLSLGNLNILADFIKKCNKLPFQPKYYTESGDKHKSVQLANKYNIKNYEYNEAFEIEVKSDDMPHFIVSHIFKKMCNKYELSSGTEFTKLYLIFLLQYHNLDKWYEISHNLFCTHTQTRLPDNKKHFCFILNLLEIEKNEKKYELIDYTPKTLTRYYKNKNNGFNPSIIKYDNQIYCMLRYETEVSKKHQRWGKSKMSYNIVKLKYKNNKLQKKYSDYCNLKTSFKFNDHSYFEIERDDISSTKVGFEDGKFIDESQHKFNDDDCVMAYFTLLRNYDVRYKFNKEKKEYVCVYHDIDTKVALCRVNLTKKSIGFVNYIDLQSQNQIDKNWAVFRNKENKYAMHTWSPLTYAHANHWTGVKFIGELPGYEMCRDEYLSISCAPIEMTTNTYVVLLHKKDQWYSYRFFLGKFQVKNKEIIKKTIYQLNVPERFHFFTSLFKISSDEIIICGGRHDCHSLYFKHNILNKFN
tara:strand:+ start:515 stop:2191 length:1677 start_codon:yes stop_codon:yes gene_type:complete